MTTGDWTAVPPSEICYSVDDFKDGELSEKDAENFRHHLAGCNFCAKQLGEGWLLDERMRRLGAPTAPNTNWKLRRFLLPVGGLFIVAMVAGFLLRSRPPTPALANRGAKARTGDQPYLPMKVGTAVLSKRPSESAPTKVPNPLSAVVNHAEALERDGKLLEAASALVEAGLADQALPYLERIPDSPKKDVLASAILLEKKDAEPEQALERADRALRQKPGFAPALWNRSLALRKLKLLAAAERALEQVIDLKEKGWGQEAIQDAKSVRDQFQKRHQAYLAASLACQRMIETGDPLSDALATSVPGLARACLYKAVRTARSAEQVKRLLPLATRLDTLDGGDWLKKYVHEVAGRSFAVRKPLAEKYLPLALGQLPAAEVPGLLEVLRRSKEKDILLGALGDVPGEHWRKFDPEYQAELTEAAKPGDPWLQMLLREQEATSARRNGKVMHALALLHQAVADCGVHRPVRAMDVRCAALQRQLLRVYTETSRTTDAREQGLKALELANAANEWGLEIKLLGDLGLAEGQGGHGSLAIGFYDEALQREPAGCSAPPLVVERPINWDVIQSNLAMEHLRELDFDAARKALKESRHCRRPNWLSRFFVQADLARRYPPTREEIADFTEGLAQAASKLGPAYKVIATHIQGRFQMEVEPALGRVYLRQAISEAEKLPDDDEAQKARTYSYTTLILAAGKNKELDEAMALFGEELRMPMPRACVLAVAAEDERALVVARGPTGTVQGRYEGNREERPENSKDLVPGDFVGQALKGCQTVLVIARPPVMGMPGLLPESVAWSYLGAAAAPADLAASASSPASGGTTLLVTSPTPPPDLGLEEVKPISFEGMVGPQVLKLEGAVATPGRAIQEMQKAAVIILHAHGLITDTADPTRLALSPDVEGTYELTAGQIRHNKLPHHPVVVLIACDAGRIGSSLHLVSSLPTAFLEAGASLVLAATTQVPTDAAPRFFAELMARIRVGSDPAVALRDAKRAWRNTANKDWVENVLLFQAARD